MIVSVFLAYDTYLGDLLVRLIFLPLIISFVNHLWCFHVFGTQDGDRGTCIAIYDFYTRLT